MGQNQMQVRVGENQKPVVKVIIKGNLFLYKFGYDSFLFLSCICMCMHVHMSLEEVIECIFLKETVLAISQGVDEKLFLSTVIFSSWSCVYIKRITEMPLAS